MKKAWLSITYIFIGWGERDFFIPNLPTKGRGSKWSTYFINPTKGSKLLDNFTHPFPKIVVIVVAPTLYNLRSAKEVGPWFFVYVNYEIDDAFYICAFSISVIPNLAYQNSKSLIYLNLFYRKFCHNIYPYL